MANYSPALEEKSVLWLKGCPRCRGDLHQDRDIYGPYIACLMCGYYVTPEEETALQNTLNRRSIAPAGKVAVTTITGAA